MIGKRIALGLLALLVGAIGILPLIVIGEATGSGIAAYAADMLIFAAAAYGLGRLDPGAKLLYAVLLCAPVLLLSLMGPDAGGAGLSVLMTAVALGAAYLARSNAAKTPA